MEKKTVYIETSLLKNSWEGLTMPDEIIEELWQIKDCMAQEYGCDIDVFVAHLQNQSQTADRQVVDLRALKEAAEGRENDENRV